MKMESEKKITTQKNQKDEDKPIDAYDNINKVYDYYLWEKNKNPSEKLYVISKEDLSKLKEIIKYADLKDFIKGDKPDIKACIEQFYKEKKIELKYSEENENIFIKIKEKKENTLDNNEEEINENVIDLYKSLGYKIEEDNKGKVDKTETEAKEKENENEKKEEKVNNENNQKEKEVKRELEAKKEDKPENNVEEKQEKKKEEKKEEIKEEKKEEKKEENEVTENKDVPKEEVHKNEGNNEEKKEENKEAKENKDDKGKKEEIKAEKKEEDKDKIQDGKKEEKMTEKQEIKNEEINKEDKSNENNKNLENDQKKEGQTQTVESEQSKEPSEKNEEIKNQEAQNIPKKKEEGENKEIANPPKQKSTNKEEEKEKTTEEKIREKIIDYDEDEKKENEEEKETHVRKKSDIIDKILNNNTEKEGKEGIINGEEDKDKKLLQNKRNNDKNEIQNESDKDLTEEKPKIEEKEENEINTKEKKDTNPENKENQIETQNNEQNTINNEENINTNSDNINNNNSNNNIQDPQMTLQMMQFQEMFMKKYFFEHGSENSFINNYYQSASNEPEEGLPQVVNGRIKLRSDIPSLGLQNVGATCYMNATLQCLMHIKELDEILLSAFFFNYPRENKNYAEKHKLSNQFVTLLSQVYFPKLNGNPNKYYAPYDFKNLISEINPLFAGYAANDAKDLLQCILENMHQELKQATQVFYDYTIDQKNEQIALQYFFNSYITQNKSPINDLLYGINEMKTTCSLCKITKYNFQCYNLLYFPLKEAKRVTVLKKKEEDENFDEKNYVLTLEDCFEHNEHVDHFTGNNQMYCNDCNKEADADYQTVLFTAPTILSIVLNRGRGNLDFQEDFKFGIDLDIKKYIHNPFIQNGKYYLIGMVVHLGGSDLSGHFIAYCRMDKNSDWFCYNDAFVDKIDNIEEKFNINKPYILFYHYDNEENKEIKENENKENNENNEK